MERTYTIEFESDAQREQFEALLERMGIPFHAVEAALLAEEAGADYRTAPEETPEFREKVLREIRLGIEDIEAGRVVPIEKIEEKLRARLKRYDQKQ